MTHQALIDELSALCARYGAERFIDAPLIEPTHEYFGEPWNESDDALMTLARDVFAYADVDVEVVLDRDDAPFVHTVKRSNRVAVQTTGFGPIEVSAVGPGTCNLAVHGVVGDASAAVASLCRAAAVLFDARARGPGYRDGSFVPPSTDDERRRVDLMTLYLGFGILTTNDSYRFVREKAPGVGPARHVRGGFLDEHAMSALLAAQVHAKGDRVDPRRVAKLLEPNQRAYFEEAIQKLGQREPRV